MPTPMPQRPANGAAPTNGDGPQDLEPIDLDQVDEQAAEQAAVPDPADTPAEEQQ